MQMDKTNFLGHTGLKEADLIQIQRLPFFRGLEDQEIIVLLTEATTRTFHRGTQLFAQEEPADRFFIVLEGWVKLSRETKDGHESIIGLFTRGESFAEAAMFESAVFPVDGTVVEDSRLLVIPTGSFRHRLSERPELMFKLLGAMSRHMRRLVTQIEQLTARTSAERVAAFLVGLAVGTEPPIQLQLPLDKVLIAGRLGMQPETFSRAIARLRNFGVEVTGSNVVINDPRRLKQLAEGDLRS